MAGFFFQPQRHQKGEEIAVQVLFPAYVTVVPYLWNHCFLPMKRENVTGLALRFSLSSGKGILLGEG